MSIADISIRRPVLMTMLVMTFVVLGIFSLTRLGIDMTPKIELPYVVVSIIYPGAGPEEMETQVADPIEEVVSGIGGIKHITSSSQEGLSLIIMEFDLEMDVDLVAIDVKDKVDQIRYNLPEDILDPIIQKFDIGAFPIINLALTSPRSLEETYRIADDVVKSGLSRVRGLAEITLSGGLQREIQVNLSRRKMKAYNLSPQLVTAMIGAHNLNIPAGSFIQNKKEITIRLEGEFDDLDDLRNLEISIDDKGNKVRLKDIAWIDDTFEKQKELAQFNGESSVGLALVKRTDANTVEVAKKAFEEIDKLRQQLPEDFKLEVARDRSQFIKDMVADVWSNVAIGVLLTVIVLYLFLHSVPSTIIAAVAMPTSIISAFVLIDFAGFTLNMMSLMALAISVGILVANSIVVLENIERYKSLGFSAMDAASKGTKEIGLAVAASTLTNIVVFTPMAFMSGIVGQFFIQFGLTVAFATIFSLLVSFTLTPMMASRPIKPWFYLIIVIVAFGGVYYLLGIDVALVFLLALALAGLAFTYGLQKKLSVAWNRFYEDIAAGYKQSLIWSLKHRIVVIGFALLLFIGSISMLGFGIIGSEFFPSTDQGEFSVYVEMPIGTTLDETDRVVNEIGQRVMNQQYVKTVYTNTGKSETEFLGSGEGTHLGMIVVQMVNKKDRPINTAAFIDEMRLKLTDIPDAKIIIRETEPMGGGGESDLQVEITGQDIKYLNSIVDSMMTYMEDIGGLINISSSWKLGKPELRLTPDSDKFADRGFSTGSVGMTLRNLIEGEVASKFREEGEEYDIRVQLDDSEIKSESDVGDIYIPAGKNQVLLSEVANIKFAEGPASIAHKDKQRMVVVSADVANGTIGEKLNVIKKRLEGLKLKTGYHINFGGEAEMMGEAFGELFKALFLAIILTYMLLAAILESYKHPFTIMLTLPLGLIGVILALFITNNSISMLSLMAMVMLVGIVVNNGILLIDYTNKLRSEGMGLEEAIIEACPIRLRPIIMMNIATALGMTPLAFGLGAGGEMRAPMAIVAIGGLMTSVIFTMYVIPVIYRLFEKEK
ncbi:efflux RND transporter permease subunit [bacterium]|nr:efflux RND transporter permease subunit [bacterium]